MLDKLIPNSETGASARTKINTSFTQSDSNKSEIYDANSKIAAIDSRTTNLEHNKVDKVAGKSLSSNDYTDDEKSKLASIEDSLFKGTYSSMTALRTAHPTAPDGSYAYIVSTGNPDIIAIWDGTDWDESGEQSSMTASEVKTKYESNPDTNAFTDSDKTNVQANTAKVESIDTTSAKTTFDRSVETTTNQVVPPDTATALQSKEFITIGNVIKQFQLFEKYALVDKGAITDVKSISETGLYEGTNVLNSPTEGTIIVLAHRDSHGNFGYFLLGDDSILYLGGRANSAPNIMWQAVLDEKHIANLATTEYVNAAIVNTFYGSTLPDNSLGKDNDRYRRFPTVADKNVFNGNSYESYSYDFFRIKDFDSSSTGLAEVSVLQSRREIELYYGYNKSDDLSDFAISINGGAFFDLTIKSSSDSAIVLSYTSAFDADIMSIVQGTPIIIKAFGYSGEYKDYIKYDDKWIIFEHFGRPEVTYNYSNTPTRVELIEAYKLTNNPDWIHNKDFYVKDSGNNNLLLVKYRANGALDEATAGEFYYEKLTKAN